MKVNRVASDGEHAGQGSGGHVDVPRMTFFRALFSQILRLRRSPLVPLHLICALAAGGACGAYFAFAPWDPSFGTDAYVKLLGAMMPLMVGIVCGLDVDAENEATGLSNLLSVPSRRIAFMAHITVLFLMGVVALALAVGVFAGILAISGRNALEPAIFGGIMAGLSLGSALLYAIYFAVALRFGRNVSIAVGAVGLMIAFFSVGGLAHGLMTGELTAVSSAGGFGYIPLCWAARLGSLAVELSIAYGSVASAGTISQVVEVIGFVGSLCALAVVVIVIAQMAWIDRFESARCSE